MSDEPTTPPLHPEEQLAAYVGGSASPEEHALVERHLLICPACRTDVRLAQRGRDALRALPALDAPGIAATLRLPKEEPTGGEVVSLDDERARRRWQRVTVALGAAAAASVVAVALVLHVGGGPSPSGLQSRAQPLVPSERDASSGAAADYTAQSLAALARQLRSAETLYGTSPAATPIPRPATAQMPASRSVYSPDATASGRTCLREAAGLAENAELSFFQVGSFEGTPAYIGAFLTGEGRYARLIVVAASRDGCRALDVISERP
jgi:hypothetical protein